MNTFEYKDMEYIVTDETPNLNTKIEKKGIAKTEFTIREFLGENVDLKKALKEHQGTKKMAELHIQNVKEKSPEIVEMLKELKDGNLRAAVIYLTNMRLIESADIVIPQYEDAIKENEETIKAITDGLGISLESNEVDLNAAGEVAK